MAGEGVLLRVLGAGVLPALPKGDRGMRSASFTGVGKGACALPSTQSSALDSRANKGEAKEDSRNFILHFNL